MKLSTLKIAVKDSIVKNNLYFAIKNIQIGEFCQLQDSWNKKTFIEAFAAQ